MANERTAASSGMTMRECARGTARFLVVGALALWSALPASAAPTVSAILNFKPKQEGVVPSMPDGTRLAECKVELVKGRGNKGSGWLLRDVDGKPMRLFFDTNEDNKIDVWSYYKDGVEIYREIDSTFQGKPDQYRWLNSAGTKWGVDENRDGQIDSWKVISPEEVSQEILAALAAKNLDRFKAVLISETELKTLEMPAESSTRIKEALAKVETKFAEVTTKLPSLSAKPTWIHLETGAPQCIPGDRIGARYDIYRHPRGTILFEAGGKNDWIQTGEMIQVGLAWRVTDAPTPGAGTVDADPMARKGTALDTNPKLAKLVEELTARDRNFTAKNDTSPAATAQHHLGRADLLERIVAEVKPEDRDPWIRQVADSLGTAAQSGDAMGLTRLLSLEKQLTEAMPGHNLAAYVTFREMQADYSKKIGEGNFEKTQQAWLERLGKFVATYPKAEDTADALLQCGMVSEFLNKEVDAKNWYAQLVKTFPDKPQALKAAGAVRRLDLDNKSLKLAGPLLSDPSTAFDIDQMTGKIVIVYYWASWNSQSVGDFAKIKLLLDQSAGKVELLCVNLDNTAEEARAFLKRSPTPGIHLFQQGGLEGKLATEYGIMVLPNLFLVGKDGKVANKSVQVSNLDEEIKKLLK